MKPRIKLVLKAVLTAGMQLYHLLLPPQTSWLLKGWAWGEEEGVLVIIGVWRLGGWRDGGIKRGSWRMHTQTHTWPTRNFWSVFMQHQQEGEVF